MALAFDAKAQADNSPGFSSTTVTWNHTVTGTNPILLVHVRGDTSDNVTGVTYNTVAMTQVGKATPGTGGRWNYLYALVAPATGTHSVVATASTNISFLVESVSLTGARQTSNPETPTTTQTNSGTSLTLSRTPNFPSSWLIGTGNAANGGLATGTNLTLRQIGTNTGSGMFDSNGTISGATSGTINFSSGEGSLLVVVVAPDTVAVAAVTQVAGTATATGGTQTLAATQIGSVAQSAASVTASGGTQVVASVNIVSITQVAANVTATGGTQVVAAVRIVAVAQSNASVTASGGTQSVATVNIVAITQVAASPVATGGTQAVATVRIAAVTQLVAHILASGGTQAVSALRLGGVYYWNGSAWLPRYVKVWNGSSWVVKPLKKWTGSTWTPVA